MTESAKPNSDLPAGRPAPASAADAPSRPQKVRKPARIDGVKGMHDVLPGASRQWQLLEETVAAWAQSYGYQQIRTPIVEPTPLFRRGLGDVTDIVEKEMYSFQDALNGEDLTLRPEMTAGVVRAVIEHNLLYDGPRRLWYTGPMFRHERPQRGRSRQFHQIGVEALGYAGPDVDVEVIAMCQRLWDTIGLDGIRLHINSIGDPDERAMHRARLIEYLSSHEDVLDAEAKRRLHSNPLRILDSKNPTMQDMLKGAPRLIDFLGTETRAHFDSVCQQLADLGIQARIDHRLVRGMDYYNRTVFEWVTDQLGAQSTVCGGGRYDGLIGMLGGKPAPACGFAIGMERLLDLAAQQNAFDEPDMVDVYVVHDPEIEPSLAMRVAEQLRGCGVDVIMNAGGGSFKSQFKRADASGAALAVVLGKDEVARREFGLKRLRTADDASDDAEGAAGSGTQQQTTHRLTDLTDVVAECLFPTGSIARALYDDDDDELTVEELLGDPDSVPHGIEANGNDMHGDDDVAMDWTPDKPGRPH